MKRCMGCMSEYSEAIGRVCPHCGYVDGTPVNKPNHIQPGTMLHGRYILGKVLGSGGFGITYIGWDDWLKQKVAIKEYFPSASSTRDPGNSRVTALSNEKEDIFYAGMKKFVEEARNLAKFQNEPGIVRIFDTFEENGTAYLIMEYLDGETLKEYLKREGTLSWEKTLELMLPLMKSLQKIHAVGMVHRDISPENIMLTQEGDVKLIDFGAARYVEANASHSLTVIVKQGYSPEEQYRTHGEQGPHTDIYSLAMTMYRMITGETGQDALERMFAVESGKKDPLVSPRHLVKNLPANVDKALMHALKIRIQERTPDVETFLKELGAKQQGNPKGNALSALPLGWKIGIPVCLLAVVFGVLTMTGVVSMEKNSEEASVGEEKDTSAESGTEESIVVEESLAAESSMVEESTPAENDAAEGMGLTEESSEESSAEESAVTDPIQYIFIPGDINNVIARMTPEEAINYLCMRGFKVKPEFVYAEQDMVQPVFEFNQRYYDSGETKTFRKGDVVTLDFWMRNVPAEPSDDWTVPNVVGMTEKEAIEAFFNHKTHSIWMEFVPSDGPEGIVLAQNLEAGSGSETPVDIVLTISLSNAVGEDGWTEWSTLRPLDAENLEIEEKTEKCYEIWDVWEVTIDPYTNISIIRALPDGEPTMGYPDMPGIAPSESKPGTWSEWITVEEEDWTLSESLHGEAQKRELRRLVREPLNEAKTEWGDWKVVNGTATNVSEDAEIQYQVRYREIKQYFLFMFGSHNEIWTEESMEKGLTSEGKYVVFARSRTVYRFREVE